MTVFRRSRLNQVVYQPESVLFVPDVAEGIIAVRLLQVDEVQHPDVIALALEVAARGQQDFRLGVRDHIVGVGFEDIRLHIGSRLARTGAADDQHVQGAAVLVGVQPQADIFGQQLVLFLSEHGVDLPWGGPGGGAVFLAVTGSALLVGVEAYPHDVRPGAGQDGHKASIRPVDVEGVFHCRCQVGDDVGQAAVQGLGQQHRRPDHGDIEEQVNGEFTRPGWLIQIVLTSKKYSGPKDLHLDRFSGPVLRWLRYFPVILTHVFIGTLIPLVL